jgi:Protein of unknown function (DUF1348)
MLQQHIKPPFTEETARLKVQAAEDAWNSRNPDEWRWLTPRIRNGAIEPSSCGVVKRFALFFAGSGPRNSIIS